MHLNRYSQTLFEDFEDVDQSFMQHFHDTYSIGITHSGMFKSDINGKNSYFYANYTRVVNPAETHGGEGRGWACTNFYPSVDTMSEIHEQIFHNRQIPIFPNHTIDDQQMYNLFYSFFYSVYHQHDSMEIETNKILALSYLVEHYTCDTKNPDSSSYKNEIITDAITYINDMIDTNIALEDLAKSVSMSKYHFLRLFKHHTGATPHNYIMAKRVQKATEMIIAGVDLSEASYSAGFSDQSHFTRSFKKVYGYTPSHIHKKSNIILYS